MIDNKVVNFFKKHNIYSDCIFEYISNNINYIDYELVEYRSFIGCYYIMSGINLSKFKIIVPRVINDITLLINIHEFVHGIDLYNYIDKVYIEPIYSEVLPIFYEKLFIKENYNNDLVSYDKNIDTKIKNNNIDKYLYGLSLQDKLMDSYSTCDDYNSMILKVKGLSKKNMM